MLFAWPVFFWAKTGKITQIRKTAKKLLAIRKRVPDNKLAIFLLAIFERISYIDQKVLLFWA